MTLAWSNELLVDCGVYAQGLLSANTSHFHNTASHI